MAAPTKNPVAVGQRTGFKTNATDTPNCAENLISRQARNAIEWIASNAHILRGIGVFVPMVLGVILVALGHPGRVGDEL